ncbi:hypothetical protein [Roseovarius albus]|nr:hypothetical protein [Roseovarius albus]
MKNISIQSNETRFIFPATAWEEFCFASGTTADALDLGIRILETSGEA